MTQESPPELTDDHGLAGVRDALRLIFAAGRVLVILLVVAFVFSGTENLEQFEHGVVLRFGAVTGDVRDQPGLLMALPYPVDRVVKVPAKSVQTVNSKTFQYAITDVEAQRGFETINASLKPGLDGYALTGDGDMVHLTAAMEYQIGDSVRYGLMVAQPRETLQRCLDNAILHEVAAQPMETVLRDKGALQARVAERLQQRVDQLRLGVTVARVDLTVSWPRQLNATMNAMVQATQDADAQLTAARLYEQTRLNDAESEAAKIRGQALNRATRITAQAEADAKTLRELYEVYLRNPHVVREILYQDRLRQVAAQVDEIFLLEKSNSRELRLAVPRSDQPDRKKKQDGDAAGNE